MKNGIKAVARMVKQLAEALDGVKDLAPLSDEKAAATLIQEAGFDPWDRKIKSIPTLETLMGKEKFDEVCGSLVVKPEGKMKLERADRRRG